MELAFHGTDQEYENAKARVIGGSGSSDDIAHVRTMSKNAGKSDYKEALKSAGLE